jgi:hypothetical protein
MISIGNLAKIYGLLPSEVALKATSFDLMVTDVMTTWDNFKNNPENENNYKTEDLEQLVRDTR